MAKLSISYAEAQEYIRESLGLPDSFDIVIERKDSQDRRNKSPTPKEIVK